MADNSSDEDQKRRQTPPPVEFVRPSEAQGQAPPRDQPPAAWGPRPEEFGQPPQQPFPQAWPQVAPRTGRPIIGGALLILSGLLGMVSTYLIFIRPLAPSDVSAIQNMTAGDLTANALLVFAVVYAQAFAILGGIMAIQRKNWKLAVVCGVASLLNFGFFLIGTFLGLAGLIAIITARRDFIGYMP